MVGFDEQLRAEQCIRRSSPVVAEIVKPRGRAGYHRAILLWTVAVMGLSFVLDGRRDGRLRVPLLHASLPAMCAWKSATGMDCPGCGLTRCFVAMAHGRWREAFRDHPVGMLLFAVLAAQLPYRGLQLGRIKRGKRELCWPGAWLGLWLLSALMLIQWVLRAAGALAGI
jgi:hypothetical protein